MLKLLEYLEQTLGSYAAAAGYLSYSERQYYNIRRRIKAGEPLLQRVEVSLLRKISHFLANEIKKRESQS